MTATGEVTTPIPQVSEVMTGPVIYLDVEQTVEAAARIMRKHRTSEVVITESGRPVGVVADRALSTRLASSTISGRTLVGEICPTEFLTVAPDDDVRWAAQQMTKHSMRRVPVLSGETIVGFLSVGDIAGFFDADDWRTGLSPDPQPS
jgi:CBS domain-containing protein